MTELTVKKIAHYTVVTDEQLREAEEFREGMAREQARRAALTPAQRAAEDAEWEARRAAEKEARTCKECDCDPDEHGGY